MALFGKKARFFRFRVFCPACYLQNEVGDPPFFFAFLTSLTHHLSMVKFSEKKSMLGNFRANVLNSLLLKLIRVSREVFLKYYIPGSQKIFPFFHKNFHLNPLRCRCRIEIPSDFRNSGLYNCLGKVVQSGSTNSYKTLERKGNILTSGNTSVA